MLASRFFSNARPVEGTYHVDAAAGLVLASGLHRINFSHRPVPGHSPISRDQLLIASDNVNEQERISGFWAILT